MPQVGVMKHTTHSFIRIHSLSSHNQKAMLMIMFSLLLSYSASSRKLYPNCSSIEEVEAAMEFQRGERKKHRRLTSNLLLKDVTPPMHFTFPCMHSGRRASGESLLVPVDWESAKVTWKGALMQLERPGPGTEEGHGTRVGPVYSIRNKRARTTAENGEEEAGARRGVQLQQTRQLHFMVEAVREGLGEEGRRHRMPEGISARRLVQTDFPAVADLLRGYPGMSGQEEGVSEEALREAVWGTNACLWVVVAVCEGGAGAGGGGGPVGALLLSAGADVRYGRCLTLEGLVVRDQFRGRGIGAALLSIAAAVTVSCASSLRWTRQPQQATRFAAHLATLHPDLPDIASSESVQIHKDTLLAMLNASLSEPMEAIEGDDNVPSPPSELGDTGTAVAAAVETCSPLNAPSFLSIWGAAFEIAKQVIVESISSHTLPSPPLLICIAHY